jgi:hypothetical protein
MRGGKAANLVLICGIQFFIIDLRDIGWLVYSVGAVLYVITGVRYVWREALRWRRRREAPPNAG